MQILVRYKNTYLPRNLIFLLFPFYAIKSCLISNSYKLFSNLRGVFKTRSGHLEKALKAANCSIRVVINEEKVSHILVHCSYYGFSFCSNFPHQCATTLFFVFKSQFIFCSTVITFVHTSRRIRRTIKFDKLFDILIICISYY